MPPVNLDEYGNPPLRPDIGSRPSPPVTELPAPPNDIRPAGRNLMEYEVPPVRGAAAPPQEEAAPPAQEQPTQPPPDVQKIVFEQLQDARRQAELAQAEAERLRLENESLKGQTGGPPRKPGEITLPPLAQDQLPLHYQASRAKIGDQGAMRNFQKDKRIAEYLLGKGITPEQFEALPLEEQNAHIVNAPGSAKGGKNRPYISQKDLPPGSGSRGAEEGIPQLIETLRYLWRLSRPAQ